MIVSPSALPTPVGRHHRLLSLAVSVIVLKLQRVIENVGKDMLNQLKVELVAK